MKYFLVLLITFYFHGINVGKFTFNKKEDIVYITIDLEASDLSDALKKSIESIKKNDIETYLKDHISYQINEKSVSFKVQKINLEFDHFTINTQLDQKIDSIKSVQIKNTTLFEINADQSNIIELRFNGLFRDFLIDKNKPSLNINI